MVWYIAAALLGSIIGSFLSVCIFRIPYGRPKGPPSFEEMNGIEVEGAEETQQKESVEKLSISYPPRSFCPECRKQLLWWHNIPVISWLILKGKCYFCKTSVSYRYPLVEVLTAVLAVSSVYSFGLTLTALGVFIYCSAIIVISFIDLEYYIIPDVISLPAIVIGIIVGVANQFFNFLNYPFVADVWQSLLGVAFGGGILLLISEFYLRVRKKVGLGFGDVKLLAMTGAFFGWQGAFATMLYGSLLGSIIGVSIILFSKRDFAQHIPFGPYLGLGTIIFIFLTDLSTLNF